MFRRFALALAAACASIAMDSAMASEPPPLEAYGELPAFEDASISPSGDLIAVIATVNGTRALIVLDDQNTMIKSTPVANLKVFGMDWIGEEQILLRVSQTEDLPVFWTSDQAELQQMLLVPVRSNERAERIFENESEIADRVFGYHGMRKVDGEWKGYFGGLEVARTMRNDVVLAGRGVTLFEVDLKDNTVRRAAAGAKGRKSRDWLIDTNGKGAVTIETNSETGEWRIFSARGGKLAEGRMEIARVGLFAFGANGDTVIYTAQNPETDEFEWFEVPLDGSSAPVEIFRDHRKGRYFVDRLTGQYMGFLGDGDDDNPEFVDAAKGQTIANIMAAFPNSRVRIGEWTPDFSKFLVRTDGAGDSGTWYVIDVAAGEANMFGIERPAIAPLQVGPVSTFKYSARDDLKLDGILTLPPGREARDLPVVMLPHGGPHAHDTESFDWWAQAFASRGYAVFQPNFRGSTNRDAAFRSAGYGEWGRKMQTDITDGLEALAADGIVDPSRACIMGASYGGYAALAGVTIEQGIYKCSVAIAPVTDIGMTISQDISKSGSRTMRNVLMEEFGEDVDYDAVSPRRLAHKADAPILLIHGREDTVVPYRQSKVMADALEEAGKPFELVDMKSEDHWLTRSATRLEMLTAALEFVQRHNPAD